MQLFTQYQVILKPDPGQPSGALLGSLEALASTCASTTCALWRITGRARPGAWGLGWEVWLDGQEISQYTYFQQSGGLTTDPVAVELNLGLERIVMYLQGVRAVWDVDWDGMHTYRDIYMRSEIEQAPTI